MFAPSQGEGFCLPHHPWVVRVAGPPLNENHPSSLTGLIFTPSFPCGATIDNAGVDSNAINALITVARYGGCAGGTEVPRCIDGMPVVDERTGRPVFDRIYRDGELVLIRGTVSALQGEHNPADVARSWGSCDRNVQPSTLEVKLAVRACGLPEPVIIDADSEVVIPAGPFTIDVLAPHDWFPVPGLSGSVETRLNDVTLRVTACPCDCSYHPQGRLTEAWTQDENFEPMPLVRPRRSKLVTAFGRAAALTPATVTLDAVQRPGSNAPGDGMGMLNSSVISGQPQLIVGCAPFYNAQIATGSGIGRIGIVWGIE